MSAALTVLEAGPSSTIQDSGRYGFLRYGVASAGPCDTLFHAIANRLVGNRIGTAAIEFTLAGDRYRVTADSTRVAIAGDATVDIDGKKVPSWRSYTLNEGQILSVGTVTKGLRGYVAVAGGLDLQPQLGSLSVHARSGIGPMGGTPLRQGAIIPIKHRGSENPPEYEFDISLLPETTDVLRVVMGPQDEHFQTEDLAALVESRFTLTPQCDRMGCQLSGPKINYRRDKPLISEGIALGSVQVPGEGLFIVALRDRQTVGGYPKIATVISPDIRRISQARPGAVIRFQSIDIAAAQAAAREYAAFVGGIDKLIKRPGQSLNEALLSKNLISGVYCDGS